MIKYTLVLVVGLFWRANGYAQNKTIKMYLQQIAANKVYVEHLQKGYALAKSGLTIIGNIKQGHFTMDTDFFASLENVNPGIRTYVRVGDIMVLNNKIVLQYKRSVRQASTAMVFNTDELEYIADIYSQMLDACSVLLDELTMIITYGELKMTDDERIKRIDEIFIHMQDRYVFTSNFSSSIEIFALQRAKSANEINLIKKTYGLQ